MNESQTGLLCCNGRPADSGYHTTRTSIGCVTSTGSDSMETVVARWSSEHTSSEGERQRAFRAY